MYLIMERGSLRVSVHRLVKVAMIYFLLYVESGSIVRAFNNTSKVDRLLSGISGMTNLDRAVGRIPATTIDTTFCDSTASENPSFRRYFDGMKTIYKGDASQTCLPAHMQCGWPAIAPLGKKLPMLVLSVGLEGAGHHLWTEIFKEPVFDCVWVNGRHYRRDIADGVPRITSEELMEGTAVSLPCRN
jgi:hypothetical protein